MRNQFQNRNFTKIFCVIITYFTTFLSFAQADFLAPDFMHEGVYSINISEITDENGENLYRIYAPENIQDKAPVVIWGNGTNALPDNYDGIMRHLAQWGYVVIDTYCKTTGTGLEMSDAVHYAISSQSESDHMFYDKIDIHKIATIGHSQGAVGAINSHTNYEIGKHITTVVSISLPALLWTNENDKYDVSKISCPFLVLGGSNDLFISPIASNQNAVENTIENPALCLMLKDVGHNDIQNTGETYKSLLVGWLNYQLKKDAQSELIFKGKHAEIYKIALVDSVFVKNM